MARRFFAKALFSAGPKFGPGSSDPATTVRGHAFPAGRLRVGRHGWRTALVLAASIAASPAKGDEATDAEALIVRAVTLREQGKDADALVLFERAEAMYPSARAEAQIALAKQALGRWIEAEAGLVKALTASADDRWIAENRGALDQALATVREHLGWLAVDTDVTGAEVLIEGLSAATLPLSEPLRVPAGVLVVEVRARGYQSAVRRVQVGPGEHAREWVALAPVATSAEVRRNPSDTASTSSPLPSSQMRTFALLSLGTAAALITGGVAAHVVRETYASKYDSASCLVPGRGTRDAQCVSHVATVHTATSLAVVGYAAGGRGGYPFGISVSPRAVRTAYEGDRLRVVMRRRGGRGDLYARVLTARRL